MNRVPDAARLLLKRHPDVRIEECAVYNQDYYLFTAPSTPKGVPDYNDPYYLVGTMTNDVLTFDPTSNMDNFLEAIRKRNIDLRKAGLR